MASHAVTLSASPFAIAKGAPSRGRTPSASVDVNGNGRIVSPSQCNFGVFSQKFAPTDAWCIQSGLKRTQISVVKHNSGGGFKNGGLLLLPVRDGFRFTGFLPFRSASHMVPRGTSSSSSCRASIDASMYSGPTSAGRRKLLASHGVEDVFGHDSSSSRDGRKRSTVCASSSSATAGELSPSGDAAVASKFEKLVDILTNLFPVWVIIGTIVGLFRPSMVTWIQTDVFTLGLGLLMLSMGLTLTFEDFRRCLRNPWTVGVGFLAQYMVKPLLGFTLALSLRLPAPLATGLILVSCCPGGQASNVATYISKGNVALSVLMTTCSTVGAIIMTPLLTKILAGQLVPVDAMGLAISTFQVVLLPTIVGVLSNEYFPNFTKKITFFTPLVGVLLTTLLCASPIGQVSEVLKTQGMGLLLPVGLLHAFAFFFGYWISRACKFGEVTSRTVSIECGMQSSALGFLLAQKHFTNPLVAVPSAVSVVFMALGGAMLAVFWRLKGIPLNDKDDFKE